jgi:hypothetical protein
MSKLQMVVCGALLVTLLSGCAGGLLLWAFQTLALGAVALTVTDYLGRDASEFTLLLNGYDLGIRPSPSGVLNLNGLPAGDHLLSLVSTDRRVGFHRPVTIQQGGQFNLGQVTPLQGAIISGRLERDTGGGRAPLAGVRVAAVLGGLALLHNGGPALRFPPVGGPAVVMGFTDAQGNYRLGPCEYGDWLITAALPGYQTDVALATVQSGVDAAGRNLVLGPSPAGSGWGMVRGTIISQGGAALGAALAEARLNTAFQPTVAPARLAALQAQAGTALRAEPWCDWETLAAVATSAGGYALDLPTGTHEVYGFRYGYQAQMTSVPVGAQSIQTVDFTLQPLR